MHGSPIHRLWQSHRRGSRSVQHGRSVPVCAIVGSMLPGAEAFLEQAMDRSILTTVNAVMPLKQAMEDAETLYRGAAQRMFRLLRIGQAMHK